jgi:YD repeat-containing protein
MHVIFVAMNVLRPRRISKLLLIASVVVCLLTATTPASASTAGRDYEYSYDGQGRLTDYEDEDGDDDITVRDVDFVRLQGVELNGSGTGDALLFEQTDGPALASCIVTGAVAFDECDDAKVVGNTFDYAVGADTAVFTDCTDSLLRNNVFLNHDASDALGMSYTGEEPDEDFNCWYEVEPATPGAGSVGDDPEFETDEYFTNAETSVIVGSGTPMTGFDADFNGWYRHATEPCMGALEYELETTSRNSAGRVTLRTIAGRDYTYSYDGQGRLTGL